MHSSTCCLWKSHGYLGHLTNSFSLFRSSGFYPSLLSSLLSNESSKVVLTSRNNSKTKVSKSCFGSLFVVLCHNKYTLFGLWEIAPHQGTILLKLLKRKPDLFELAWLMHVRDSGLQELNEREGCYSIYAIIARRLPCDMPSLL